MSSPNYLRSYRIMIQYDDTGALHTYEDCSEVVIRSNNVTFLCNGSIRVVPLRHVRVMTFEELGDSTEVKTDGE